MDRVALISGGAKGIGRAIGLRLASEGWSVAFCYRTSAEEAAKTASDIVEKGGRALPVLCDVSDPEAAARLVQQVEETWGRIDALINCAGPYHKTGILRETPEGWASMFDNNLHPVFYLSKAAAPGMKERKWGRILAFSMADADQMKAKPMVTAHYAAKVAVLVLVKSLARALAAHGVTVNAISPGFVSSAPVEEQQEMGKKIPAGYVGSVDDAANAAMYLLSDEARYVTGGNIHLSGGWGI